MAARHEYDTEDVEYLRHGDAPLLARTYVPRGAGPFPCVLDIHGGAWVDGDRKQNEAIHKPLAEAGVVVISLDFRCPPVATYPGSLVDINYATRWVKANAARFKTRAEMVGLMGTSSGGHLAVLSAMKPADPRYAAQPLAGAQGVDARVPYVVTLWPVICPIGRYRNHTGPNAPAGRGTAAERQLQYWLTEAAMIEGSPNLALQRGDPVELPSILYLQSPADIMHPRENLDAFVAGYRKAGGHLQLELYDGLPYDLIRSKPDSNEAKAMVAKMVAFIGAEAGRMSKAA